VDRFALTPLGPYSLAASVRFLEGFVLAAYHGAEAGHFHLAFVADGNSAVAGVCIRAEGGAVVVEVVREAEPEVVRDQVARILSLDVDGRGFPVVGQRDPVIGHLQRRYPGLRPVLFYSPFEAAAWAVIGQRIRITQTARIKARMAEELGPAVTIHGETLHAFPGPTRLADLDTYPGLPAVKLERLRALGYAAVTGLLDAGRLRASPPAAALAQLKELPGVGDFSAELILLRGAGEPDYLPTAEPRLGNAVAHAYGLDQPPSAADLAARASAWHPYRTWVVLLLLTILEDETHEISRGSGSPSPCALQRTQRGVAIAAESVEKVGLPRFGGSSPAHERTRAAHDQPTLHRQAAQPYWAGTHSTAVEARSASASIWTTIRSSTSINASMSPSLTPSSAVSSALRRCPKTRFAFEAPTVVTCSLTCRRSDGFLSLSTCPLTVSSSASLLARASDSERA